MIHVDFKSRVMFRICNIFLNKLVDLRISFRELFIYIILLILFSIVNNMHDAEFFCSMHFPTCLAKFT